MYLFNKFGTVPLPLKLKQELLNQVEEVSLLHKKDLEEGFGTVYLPHAIERKTPNAKEQFKWQFLFPMKKVSTDPRSKIIRRHHVHPQTLGRNIKEAVMKSKIHKRVSSHVFRRSLCIIDYVKYMKLGKIDLFLKLKGHKSVETTMIYTHIVKELNRDGVKSPLDF